MLKEVQTILPLPDDVPLAESDAVHDDFIRAAVGIAGGATFDIVYGTWVSPDGEIITDHSRRYTIAARPNVVDELKAAALDAAAKLNQQALYWRDAEGRVEIVDVDAEEVATDAEEVMAA